MDANFCKGCILDVMNLNEPDIPVTNQDSFNESCETYVEIAERTAEGDPDTPKHYLIEDRNELNLFIQRCISMEPIFAKSGLPVYKFKTKIINALTYHNILILVSPTGTGKSTQVPAYFFSSPFLYKYSVYVVEPRKISAISLAAKVKHDLKDVIQVSACVDSLDFHSTKGSLTYFDNPTFLDILLKEQQKDFPFPDLKILILDDMHEVKLERTVILSLLLQLIKTKRPDLRILLTSATLNEFELQNYLSHSLSTANHFTNPIESKLSQKFVSIKVPDSKYEVKVSYITTSNYFKETLQTIEQILLKENCKKILVFLAGQSEVFKMKKQLQSLSRVIILTLSAGLHPLEQEKATGPISPGFPVVILATNYAESSITISDVTHVVDTGREKQLVIKGINFIEVSFDFISKASAIQRRGRAGREAPGVCYCMYSEEEFQAMQPFRNTKALSEPLDLLLLRMNKFEINFQNLYLLNKANEEQVTMTYKKLTYECAVDANESCSFKKKLKPIGDLALELGIEPKSASMLIRTKYAFEAVLIVGVLEAYENLYDFRKMHQGNEFLSAEFNDFLMILILMRQVCSIRCEQCLEEYKDFYPEKTEDFLKYVECSCLTCQGIRKRWMNSLNLNRRTVKIALISSYDIIQKLGRKGIALKNYLGPLHFAREFQYMSKLDRSFITELISVYKEVEKGLRMLFLMVFWHNLCENVSIGGTLAFKHIATSVLTVPSASSIYHNSHHDFLVCFSLEKFKMQHYLKYVIGFSFEEVKGKVQHALNDFSFKHSIGDYKILTFSNLGTQFYKALKKNSSMRLFDIESSLHRVLSSFLINYSREKSELNLFVKTDELQKANEIVRSKVNDVLLAIDKGHRVHYSLADNYLAVMGLGMEIIELISPKNEIRYIIKGLDPSISTATLTKDIENTFEVKHVSVERMGSQVEAFLYFSTVAEAEQAKRKLRLSPLKGVNEKIFEMESINVGALEGISAKVKIPCYLDDIKAGNVFGLFKPLRINVVKSNRLCSVVILDFDSKARTQFFIHNHQHVVKSLLSVSSIEVKVLAAGITIPRDLLKVGTLKSYIEDIKSRYRCEIKINFQKAKIFSQFEDLPVAVQEKLYRLVNNETLEIASIVWEHIVRDKHLLRGIEMDWENFQVDQSVSCYYVYKSKILQIFGLPEGREEVLYYLKQYSSSIMTKIVTAYADESHLSRTQSWPQIYQKFSSLEFVFDNLNTKKFSVIGLSHNVKSFLKFFYEGNVPKQQISICQVCGEDQTDNCCKLSLCGHIVHKSCFIQNISSKGPFCIPVQCYICSSKVFHEDLVMLFSFDFLQKLEKYAIDKFMHGFGKEKYAFCEIPRCGFIYEKSVIDVETLIRYCPKCNMNICTRCAAPAIRFHNTECERKWIRKHDKGLDEWIYRNAATCPKCRYSVEKSGGCNHMTCKNCDIHYCFVCSKEITEKTIMDHYSVPNSICYQRYINNNSS